MVNRVGSWRGTILKTLLALATLGDVKGQARVLAAGAQESYRPKYLYLSPIPGAEKCSPGTRFVLVRFQNISPSAVTNLATFIQVVGDHSGAHSGQTRIAADKRTVVFTMTPDFTPGEVVTVSLAPGVSEAGSAAVAPYRYCFSIAERAPTNSATPPKTTKAGTPDATLIGSKDLTTTNGVAGIMPNGVSVPSDFPWISITTNYNPDPDPIFINNRLGGYDIIFDNSGSPIWYHPATDIHGDFRVQHNGILTLFATDGGAHFDGLDNHYRLVTTYWAANGYTTDDHEIQVLPDGSYYLIALDTVTIDMSKIVPGGNPAAYVTENILQAFSSAGELVFEWRALDHLSLLDQQQFIDLTSSSFDFPHMNAIDIDTDGNVLISGRSTSEITKINRDTGDIIWRLGGVHNQFTFVNDPLNGPRNQHAIRVVTTNDYTLFDNGDLHIPPVSRGVEYVLNLTNSTARVAWQYPATPNTGLYTYYLGDVQRLPNGNSLINWAVFGLPKLTEVRPDGTKAFEMNWINQWETYRTWRSPWQGYALAPYLMVESYPDNITLLFNQFGDTNVAFYKIYGGTTSGSSNLLATSVVTLKRLTDLQNGTNYFFRVSAVNKQGVEGPFSNEASTLVNIIHPGQNMVLNGDFSQGATSWVLTNSGTAHGAWSVVSGTGYVHITSAGTALSNIQLRQDGPKLIQGNKYALQFDAWSTVRRPIEARLTQNQSPFTTYYLASPSLTLSRQHFAYSFLMQNSTDLNVRLAFNMGAALGDIYLDNISLCNVPPGDLTLDGRVDLLDLKILTADWLKHQSGLSSDLDGNGTVDFNDFGILGENWSGGN